MRRRRIAGRTGWEKVAIVVVLLTGCATGPPAERALHESRSVVSSGVEAGDRAVDEIDQIEVRSRYNPCRCPSPDFELRIEGRWQRVVIGGEDEVVEMLYERAESLASTPGLGYLWLQGEFGGQEEYPATGVEYDVFRLEDFRVEQPADRGEP